MFKIYSNFISWILVVGVPISSITSILGILVVTEQPYGAAFERSKLHGSPL